MQALDLVAEYFRQVEIAELAEEHFHYVDTTTRVPEEDPDWHSAGDLLAARRARDGAQQRLDALRQRIEASRTARAILRLAEHDLLPLPPPVRRAPQWMPPALPREWMMA